MNADERMAHHENHLREALLSSSNQFDSAILTISSGMLALSLGFIKEVVPIKGSVWLDVLLASWCLLGAAVLSTVVSFLFSQKAIRTCLENSDGSDGGWSKATTVLNVLSAGTFVLGVFLTVVFVIKNLKMGGS